jgi:hypothetical protein
MAGRKRQIKPSIFANEELGLETTDPLMLPLFAALWCLADREGRLVDRPWKIVKGFAFPYRTIADPDAMLQWLNDRGFIVRYWVHGKRYIQIVNWLEHADIHPHEMKSVIPAIPIDNPMSLNVITCHDIGDQCKTKVVQCNSLPSYTSFPSLTLPSEEGETPVAAIAAADTSPITDKAQNEDPVEQRIWKDGIDLLKRSGMTDTSARPLLGRWAKDYTRVRLAEAIAACQAVNAPDPKRYIGGILQAKAGPSWKDVGRATQSDEAYQPVICSKCGDDACLGGQSCEDRASKS